MMIKRLVVTFTFTIIFSFILCSILIADTKSKLSEQIDKNETSITLIATIDLPVEIHAPIRVGEGPKIKEIRKGKQAPTDKEKKEKFKKGLALFPKPIPSIRTKTFAISDDGEVYETTPSPKMTEKGQCWAMSKSRYDKFTVERCIEEGTSKYKAVRILDENGNIIEEHILEPPLYYSEAKYYDNGLLLIDGGSGEWCEWGLEKCKNWPMKLYKNGKKIPSISELDLYWDGNVIPSPKGNYIWMVDRKYKGKFFIYDSDGNLLWEKQLPEDARGSSIHHGFSKNEKYHYYGLETGGGQSWRVNLHILDMSNGKEVGYLERLNGEIRFSENANFLLYFSSEDNIVKVYNTKNFSLQWDYHFSDNPIDMLVGDISNNGKLVIVAAKIGGKDTYSASPIIYLLKDGKIIWKKVFEEKKGNVQEVKISPDGSLFGFIVRLRDTIGIRDPKGNETETLNLYEINER